MLSILTAAFVACTSCRIGMLSSRDASVTKVVLIQNNAGAWRSPYRVVNASFPLAGTTPPFAASGESWANFTVASSGKLVLSGSKNVELGVQEG